MFSQYWSHSWNFLCITYTVHLVTQWRTWYIYIKQPLLTPFFHIYCLLHAHLQLNFFSLASSISCGMTFIFSWISLRSCEANVELGLNGCHTHGDPYSFSYCFSLCVSIDPAWEETWNTSSSSCTCTLLANPTVTQSSASQSGGHTPTLLHKHSTLLLPQRPSKLCSQLWRGHCQNWGSLHRVWGGESWHLWNGEDSKGAYEMRTVLPEMRFIVWTILNSLRLTALNMQADTCFSKSLPADLLAKFYCHSITMDAISKQHSILFSHILNNIWTLAYN